MFIPRHGLLRCVAGALGTLVPTALVLAFLGLPPTLTDLKAPWYVALSTLFSGFLLAGILLGRGVSALRADFKRKRERKRGGAPWNGDFNWSAKGISDCAHIVPFRRLRWAMVALGSLIPLGWWGFVSGRSHWTILVLFAVAVFFLVLYTVLTLIALPSYLKDGRARLRFNAFPFHPGETLSVTLRFVETAGPNDENVYGGMVMRYSKRIQPPVSALADTVRVEFEIPDENRWSTGLTCNHFRYWELKVDVYSSRYDYQTTFPVPIYAKPPRDGG